MLSDQPKSAVLIRIHLKSRNKVMDDEQREIERLKGENKRLQELLESKKQERQLILEKEEERRLAEEERRLAEEERKMTKPNLEAENQKLKDDLIGLDVLGEYEHKSENGTTRKEVFLDNGIYEWYKNGKKRAERKWSIVKGEIHAKSDSGVIFVYRINPDKSITYIARIEDGKRTGFSKEYEATFKRIK